MTTPGGVPNLPPGALTLDTLASQTQDMTVPAMKSRAAGRFSSIFNTSTGLSPASELTPFGILTTIFSGFNSTVANADPADIDGPEDLPGLLIEWIEGLPVIGQFVDLLQAIIGEYDGEDEVLLLVQDIFAPIRKLLQLFSGLGDGDGFPTLDELIDGWTDILPPPLQSVVDAFFNALDSGVDGNTTGNPLSSLFGVAQGIIGIGQQAQNQNLAQDVRLNQLFGGGEGAGDNFDGVNGDPLNIADWDVDYYESSLGTIELKDGMAAWDKNGGVPRRAECRWKRAMTTQIQDVSVNMMTNFSGPVLSDPWFALCACASVDFLDRIEARWDTGELQIGYTIGGTANFVALDSVTYTGTTSGPWRLKVGAKVSGVDEPRHLQLLFNEAVVLEVTDSADLARIGIVGSDDWTANLYTGFIHRCGNGIETVFTTKQVFAPAIGYFAASDRDIAA